MRVSRVYTTSKTCFIFISINSQLSKSHTKIMRKERKIKRKERKKKKSISKNSRTFFFLTGLLTVMNRAAKAAPLAYISFSTTVIKLVLTRV